MRRMLLFLGTILLPAVSAQAQDLPEYICHHTATPPVIDGRGDDAVWQQAPPAAMVDVRYLSGTHFTEQPTEVRLLWDEDNLYVYYKATDPDVWSTLTDHDGHLWDEEVVEFFADPDGDGANYVEIEINSLNTVLDLLMTRAYKEGGSSHFEWNPDLVTAVHVQGTINNPSDQDEYWSTEMAIPWSAFATDILDVQSGMALPPQPGDQWRMNFYRYERVRVNGAETRIDYSAWSPVGEVNFHRPDRFGIVTFTRDATAVAPSTWARIKELY